MAINAAFSNRPYFGKIALETYGVSLFGQPITWLTGTDGTKVSGMDYFYVDSSYLHLGLNYGMLFLIIVLLIYSVVLYKAVRQKDYYLISIVTVILVFSVTEPRLMNLAFNPFPLLAFGKQMEVRT